MQVIRNQRCAQRPAGVAGGGLNPDVLELAVAQYLAIRDAIERDTSGKAEIGGTRFRGNRTSQT